jgi:RNA recognition motif-containing protein
MNIYVGNLPREATEQDVRETFAEFGEVASVAIIMDKFTGQSRGFGFVEMPNREEAQAALAGLNGRMLKERPLTVNEARPRTEGRRESRPFDRRGGGGGGERRGGGGRGRY